jgi:hypothetical protein
LVRETRTPAPADRPIAAIIASVVTLLGRRVAAIGFIVLVGATTWACGSRDATPGTPVAPEKPPPPAISSPPAPTPEPPPPATVPQIEADANDCAVIAEPGEPIVTAALHDRIDPANAPRPSNESERLLFRQLYETLVRVDCHGRIAPGLAVSWRLDADGRTWMVTLRENARFSDDTPVTPADVRTGWTLDGVGDELRPHVSRLVQSIVPVDDRVLAVTLRSQGSDAPLALAHPVLAIARPVADVLWPLGTRADRSAAETAPSVRAGHSVITVTRDHRPPIRFLPTPGDPRDLLDDDVDLLLTRDPATLDYAATLPHFRSVPLEWRHTHVLLMPARSPTSASLSAKARQVLADDAVRGEARGATEPFWWQTLEGCKLASPHPRDLSPPTPRIVYDAADDAARDLAERLVGLGRVSSSAATALLDVLLPDRPRRMFQRAAGLTGEPLALARRRGTDAGYIMAFDRRPLDPCREMEVAMDGARWLDPATIVPLVDTRLQAIVRRGRSGVTAEWDGALLIAGSSDPR